VKLIRFFIIISLATLFFLAGFVVYYQSQLEVSLTIPEQKVIIEIEQGDTLNKVLKKLSRLGVIDSTWVAKLYAKQEKLASALKVGEFILASPLTIPSLFQVITSNEQIKYRIQFIEGSTFKQMKAVLASKEKLNQKLTNQTDDELIKLLNIEVGNHHLEGLFYPDTYVFHKGDTDISILKRAHQRLQLILNEQWASRQKNLPLKDKYQALILASIVEKETGAAHERSEIAGVFIRRLEKRMRLQTDPTVIYGLGDRYQGNITRKHLKEMTPYNTYRIKGLPPTPIAMVGRDAIHAAVHPDDGNSLYFVAKGDGTHQFSATIGAHNRAVRKYQLTRRAGYRSSQK
jgi:UPF0755 protein